MKKPVKGTPHPRHRKPLEIITNRQHLISSHPHVKKENHKKEYVSAEATVDQKAATTAQRRLDAVHDRLTKLFQKVEATVAAARKLNLAGGLEGQELDKFLMEISNIENKLQEWDNMLAQAATRPNAMNESSLPIRPIQQCILSSSPLLPSHTSTTLHFHTPTPPRKRVTFAENPLIKSASTPSLETLHSPNSSSPPRRPSLSTSVSSSCPATPSLRNCEELATPKPPLEILARYPNWFQQFRSSGRSRSTPPTQDALSPPKTCAVMPPSPGSSSSRRHSPLNSPTMTFLSPFHTAGLVLRLPRFGENLYSDD